MSNCEKCKNAVLLKEFGWNCKLTNISTIDILGGEFCCSEYEEQEESNMDTIRQYKENEKEYKNLQQAVEILIELVGDNFGFSIEDGLFDGGQNWWWTSIVTHRYSDKAEWWTFTPSKYCTIVNADSDDKIRKICEEVVTDSLYKAE